MPTRRLGRTNERLSLVGRGGFHLGMPHLADADAIALIHAGIDCGITFLDNSWDYNRGNSELRMGRALGQGGYRDRVFLMTKIDGRTREAAVAQLRTRRRDRGRARRAGCGQDPLHRVYRSQASARAPSHARGREAKWVRVRYGPDAAQRDGRPLRKFRETRASGRNRARSRGDRDDDLRRRAHPLDRRRVARRDASLRDALTDERRRDGNRFAGEAREAATSFRPLAADAVASLLARTAAIAATGTTELYKTTRVFDSTEQNPQWLDSAIA